LTLDVGLKKMPTAIDVARWIVHHTWDDLGAPVDPMTLEKLIYYAQCFNLVLHDRPLFSDEILAWQKGPVVAAVYTQYSVYAWNKIAPEDEGDPPKLMPATADFLKQVVSFFGRYTATQLSEATHEEEPWRESREDIPTHKASDVVIPQLLMKTYYRTLANGGEVALSRHEMLHVVPEPRWASYYIAGICARRMREHPFYEAALAKKLSEPVEPAPSLSDEFYAPSHDTDLVEFGPFDDIEEKIKSAR
jgi:uncharacterized phage-associated protein